MSVSAKLNNVCLGVSLVKRRRTVIIKQIKKGKTSVCICATSVSVRTNILKGAKVNVRSVDPTVSSKLFLARKAKGGSMKQIKRVSFMNRGSSGNLPKLVQN
jgi:hypothetical protein